MEVGQHSSGTNILVLDPGQKHCTVRCKRRNEVKKCEWTVDHRLTLLGEIKTTKDPQSPLNHFHTGLEEWIAHGN